MTGDTVDRTVTSRNFVERSRVYAELGRPPNAIGLSLFALVGAYVGGGAAVVSLEAFTATAVTLLATVGGYTINDYFDRAVDRINDPDRPIPRGAIAPEEALAFAGVAFIVGSLLALVVLPSLAVAIVAINVTALVAYTPLAKGRYGLGNLLISYLVGSVALFGGAAIGSVAPVIVMGVLAFQMLFGLEIIKDLEDVTGDVDEGLRTLPVVLGQRRAVGLTNLVLVLSIPLSLVPYIRGTFGLSYLGVILAAHALTVVTMWATVSRPPGTALTWVKIAMFVCMMAFAVGRLFA